MVGASAESRVILSSSLFRAFFAGFFFSAALAHAETENEKMVYQLYSNYYAVPTEESQWSKAVSQSTKGSYELQTGDNLWNISQMLFGDPFYWSKVWAINSENIFNPHEVKKGAKLIFTPGGDRPPLLQVQAAKDPVTVDVVDGKEPAPPQVSIENMVVTLPPPLRESKPMGTFPSSLPRWSFREPQEQISQFDIERSFAAEASRKAFVPFQLVPKKEKVLGQIYEIEDQSRMATEGQSVLVKVQGANAGNQYLVISYGERIFDAFRKMESIEKYILGEIQIEEVVNAKQSIYRARVLRAVQPVAVGAYVQLGRIPDYPSEQIESSSQNLSASVRVIGGVYSDSRKISGSDNFVYLGGGAQQGLQRGQIFPVFRWPQGENPTSLVTENLRKIGTLHIVDVGSHFSTAFVMESLDNIQIGDLLKNNSDATQPSRF